MFDVTNRVAGLNRKDDPGGTPSHEALSVSSEGALEISSVIGQRPSLIRDRFSSPRVVAKPCKRDEGRTPSTQDHSIQISNASNEGWGAHLEQVKGLRSDRVKRLHINVLELKAVSLSLKRFKDQCQNQTVGCYKQLNSGSVHKQTRRNVLSRDVCSTVENLDLVPSLPDNSKSQAHSRVPECYGRPTVQFESSSINIMVTASADVQTDLSKVVRSLFM